MYVDYIEVLQTNIQFVNAGNFYNITGLSIDNYNNVGVTSDNSSFNITHSGIYEIDTSVSFYGHINSEINCRLFKNYVTELDIEFYRGFGSSITIGSAGASGIKGFVAGDIIGWKCNSDIPNGWMSVRSGHYSIKRLN